MPDLTKSISSARRRLLQMHFESGVGHIGGNLSCIDMLVALLHRVVGADDEFVLSKGHSAGALYVALWSIGSLTDADLATFHGEATLLSGHPPVHGSPHIRFATGSLGHGLSLACGLALARQLQQRAGRVFCMLSDGECEEGSVWEAALFLAHRNLPVVTIVDANGLQGFGTTTEVAGLEPLAAKFESFGLRTLGVDGHDTDAFLDAMASVSGGPAVIIARTHKGGSVSFMRDRMEWHYLPMTEALYRQALAELA